MSSNYSNKTILLVEDEALIAMGEASTLTNYGYEVIIAADGENAITGVKENKIDLILMDIDLGQNQLDGTEVAQKILEEYDIPIVFLSSHTESEVVEKTEGITSYGYIVKTSGETVLVASIRMAFKLFDARIKEIEKDKLLRANEHYLKEAQTIAQVGHWKLDTRTMEVTGSDELFRIFGLKQSKPATLEDFVKVVHPDDREYDLAHIKRGMEVGEPWDIEHRIICGDGTLKWIRAKGCAVTNSTDEVIELVGVVQDITKRKQAEGETQQRNLILHNVIESISNPFYIIDVNDYTIVLANSASGVNLAERKITCHCLSHNSDAPCQSYEHPSPLS